ncbi:MAG TPA: aldo/keto reductase family protein [Acidobacteriaceae bacterium]|nr:aldo/keto reductase family protein [Acidobacteriaceae bacterium]
MQTRRLGNSDLYVSEISLGSWLTYSGGIAREQSARCIRAAFENGINFLDTANIYGRGASEELLGETLAGYSRSSYVLATKLFFPMTPEDKGLSAAQVEKQLDASLRRLRTSYVDLYQCHRYDPETPLEETLAALTRAVESGKVRYLGFSEWTAEQIERADELCRRDGYHPFVSSQPQYSMLWRTPEAAVFPACARLGIGQIVWSPLAQGVLTGKYTPGAAPPSDSRAANDAMNMFMAGRGLRSEAVLAAVAQLRPIAQQLGITLSQLALAWVLRRPEVSSAIIGATRPEQIQENAAASGLHVPADALSAAEAALQPVVAIA